MKLLRYSLLLASLMLLARPARASIAYGSINNFDTVNDTGHECHGFEIELEDCTSTNITYTYDYNHYGTPEITNDTSVAGHPKCFIRWKSKKKPDGTWASYTAIPAGPIAPTNGHMFTNPAVNFGGEHFGVGYYAPPSAVKYSWLIDDGAGNLINGGAVQVSTPTFTYYPPVGNGAPAVQAVIQPPAPKAPEPKEFGKAVWVKEIRTTTHNNNKVKLRELVSDDPDNPDDKNWRNGEPDEVETEWQILQKDYGKADGGANNEVAAAPEDLPNGDEVVTRRYEFYKYVGPLDNETGEAMGDAVGADGIHGDGIKTINGVEVDLSTVEVVGEFTGSQMAAVDVDAAVGLIDHVSEARQGAAYAARSVVVGGGFPFMCVKDGALPGGMTFDEITGVLSGTPTQAGEFQFKVTASDGVNPDVSKNYVLNVAAVGAALLPACVLDTAAAPLEGGTTSGDGSFDPGSDVTVTATPSAGYRFVNWTDNGAVVSNSATFTFVLDVNHSVTANFTLDVPQWTVATTASPAAGGTVTGAGLFDDGSSVTVTAAPSAGYAFVNWTEGGAAVSASASYTFNILANRDLTAVFAQVPTYTISLSAAPAAGGTVTGGGTFAQGASVTVSATPAAGYVFVNWKQGTSTVSSNANYTFTVSANRTLVANFQADTGTRTISTSSNPSAGGTTSGGGTYAVGAECTVVATPNADYMFKRWQDSGGTQSTSAAYTFTVSSNRSLTARFARIYPVNTSSNPAEGGSTSVSGTFEDGDDVTVTATANPGYTFVNWTEGNTVVANTASYSFKANPARNLVANFSGSGPQHWTVTVSAAPPNGGTATGGGEFEEGSDVTVNATPAAGYQFLRWTEGGVEVGTTQSYTFPLDADHSLTAVFVPVASGIVFDFDHSPIPAGAGASLPLDQMSAGITASFSSPQAEKFTVGASGPGGWVLSGFAGNYLAGSDGGSEVHVAFSHALTRASVRFAVRETANLSVHSKVRLTAVDTLSLGVPVDIVSAVGNAVPAAGDTYATGTVTVDSDLPFDSVRIEIEDPAEAGVSLICDSLAVIPTYDAGGSLALTNPNWNITLTDFGYSDFLLDNTPGFEGREYLSGEWGAAVGYTVNGSTRKPVWLEPNFIYPDWNTNSDFAVIMPITLTGSNADGLPIAQSIIGNADLEITIRYEMLDTVTGMPLGTSAASQAGAGASSRSNRYVLNQSYTVRNISGSAISGIQFFQLLHGLTSQRGVFDNRLYTGPLSDYRYDVTLAGIDASTLGAAGGSESGLEDHISFSGKVAPSAWEIGHYGIEGIDDHGIGKPSDGVHLSIEDNWSHAPYTGRMNTDAFAPSDRWIAGAQRFELPALASGQSTTMDVVLSILTGTTVRVSPEDHRGRGSCNGGSQHVGGVDFEIENVVVDGTFFGEESEADEDELADRIEDGEFVAPSFDRPGSLSQVWNLRYNGTYTGRIRLTFAYDPALIPAGVEHSRLTIYHGHNGAWEQMVGTVDPVRHTITVSTDSLSPFMVGVATENAVPTLTSAPNGAAVSLSWQGDTTGWILQENTTLDAAGWVNSPAAVTRTGQVYQATVDGSRNRCFFRLVHP